MKTKKDRPASLLKTVVIGGMIAGATGLNANAENLFSYGDMGSGSEVRSNLLEQYGAPVETTHLPTDFIIGEAKCGEGKCGEEKKAEKGKEATKTETKTTEAKTTEAKCGEGKCGEAKSGKATTTKKETKTTEAKTTEGKCGEGKCGS